ncbi:MAG: L,D-transpeptidase family protein [Aestuariivirga sp.]|nr:L,D-transpeptidase family protein [Aestuariivirga sp.]
MVHKLLLKLSVAVIAASFASQTVLADTSRDEKRKGFFESLFGTPSNKKKRKTIVPWWKEDAGTTSLYGRNNYGNEDYNDPEPIPGKGMGNLPYVPPKLVALSDPSFSNLFAPDVQSQAILAELSSQKPATRVAKELRQPILDLYRNAGFKPLWLTGDAPSERALAILAFASKVNEDGLEPLAYLPTGLSSFSNVTEQLSTDALDLAKFDVAMTAAALKLVREISGGQFEPNSLSRYNDISPERVDASQALRILAWSPFLETYLNDLLPKHPSYGLMKAELAKLQAKRLKPAYEKIAEGNPVEAGKSDRRISLVRDRMQDMGFLDSEASQVDPEFADTLDTGLSAALKKFQKSVKLRQTGILDLATVKNLNRDTSQRDIQRLVYNMERMRWLPKNLGKRFVFVNQPAYNVQVMDRGNEVWRSKVIVGKPLNQTYAFHDEMETVVFNPSWGVPQSIIVNEYLGKLRRDPSYLDRQGFKVIAPNGKVVSSSSINWAAYGSRPPFGVQQPPGKGNALGELKFLFPNSHDIYMHDTPTKNLFAESTRTFSHGCIRVENPREFAEVILGWDRKKIDRETDSRKSQSVVLSQKIPVHITYFTAWPDSTGKMNYFNDVYERDEAMEKALAVLASAREANSTQKLVQN